MDGACAHTNTGFDPITSRVYCKDCGKTVARVKAKPGKTKAPIMGRRVKK